MELLNSLEVLFFALFDVIAAIVRAIMPWIPLIAWVAFWTLAVDWVKLRYFFLRGGWVGLILLMLVTILVWGVVAPPETGTHHMLGLTVSNFVGKTVYTTAILVITFLCGSVQLSGVLGNCCRLQDDEPTTSAVH